jgi:CheY-like chemotaxis protein
MSPPPHPPRLLVAEDNPVNQEAIRRILERRGYAVTLASDGREVVDRALAASPPAFDVIFMDVQMPELDGFQATARIRATPGFDRVPIVAMTAHAMAGDKERCLAGGMTDYISKPIQRQALFDLLDRILGRPAPISQGSPHPPSPFAPAAPPALDHEALLDNLGGDMAMLADLLAVLGKTRVASLDAIRHAIATADGPALDRAAHKLAGTLGTFFALAAFEAAKNLEHLGHEGRLGEAPSAYFDLERRLIAFDLAIAALQKA